MNAPKKESDPVRANTELDYAPPWARESAREPMRPLSVERPAISPAEHEHDEIASGEGRISREDRPWQQRALEPEMVPEPAGSISNFWPTMLRMGLVCAFAAGVAAAVVLLFNPKQSVHKGLQASAPPSSATAENKVSSLIEPGPIAPASTGERSASAGAPAPQLPPPVAPSSSAPPQAVASAMPNQPAVNVETPSQQPLSTNSPMPVISPPPGDASPPAPAASPEPQPASSSAVKQNLAKQAPTLDESEITSLIARGNKFLKDGDFAAARLLFERAADAGSAEAALTLGSTYDPVVIKRLGAIAVKPDVEAARKWYQIAADRGSAAAKLQLANLPSSH